MKEYRQADREGRPQRTFRGQSGFANAALPIETKSAPISSNFSAVSPSSSPPLAMMMVSGAASRASSTRLLSLFSNAGSRICIRSHGYSPRRHRRADRRFSGTVLTFFPFMMKIVYFSLRNPDAQRLSAPILPRTARITSSVMASRFSGEPPHPSIRWLV